MSESSRHNLTFAQETFARDGVVKVPAAVDDTWIERLTPWVDQQLATPSKWVNDSNPGADSDRLFNDRYRWPDDALILDFVTNSGVAELAASLMGSDKAQLYFDHLLVKEPHTVAPTPWHQDLPYWPFLGQQISSVWVALTDATVEASSMEFVAGSHEWGNYYAPKSFVERDESDWTQGGDGIALPDIEADRSAYDIIGFDVEAGDALVFSAWILHGAPGNAGDQRRSALSTRWLGDDAVWHPHPGADPTVTQDLVAVQPGEAVSGDPDRFPFGWPSSKMR